MSEQIDTLTKNEPRTKLKTKNIWHPYSLQMLPPDKFIEVVERIRKNEYSLLARPAIDTDTKSLNAYIGSTFPAKSITTSGSQVDASGRRLVSAN